MPFETTRVRTEQFYFKAIDKAFDLPNELPAVEDE